MPLDVLSDGFVRLCIDPSLNYYDGNCRFLIEGQYVVNPLLAQPVVPDRVIRITSKRYIDEMFTAGSVLNRALHMAFCVCPHNLEIYALPRLDAAGAVAAVYTITVGGPATSDGQIDLFLGNEDYSINGVNVSSGDTGAVIAAALAAEIPSEFPYAVAVGTTVGVNDHIITLTAKNGGTVGNYLNPVQNWKGWQNYYPSGVSLTVAQTTAGSVDPAAPTYSTAYGDCCFDCHVLLTEDRDWQEDLIEHVRSNWSCDKPQCFGHSYSYNVGTTGQILATFENAGEMSKLAMPTNDVNFPWEMITAYAALSCCSACDNPELSIQGRTYGLMHCIKRPQSCELPWSYDESVLLQENGFVTYAPAGTGAVALTSPYIVNDITNYLYDELNRPNATFRDASSRRLAKKTAVALATELAKNSGLALYTRSTKVPQGIKGTNIRLVTGKMHDWARSQVGILFSQFDNLEKDLVIREDFEVAAPCKGVPCKLHMQFRYRPPCRIANVQVTMQPALLDNCVR